MSKNNQKNNIQKHEESKQPNKKSNNNNSKPGVSPPQQKEHNQNNNNNNNFNALDHLYKRVYDGNGTINKIVQLKPFDAKMWRKWFNYFNEQGGPKSDATRSMRLVIQEDTFECCNDTHQYKLPSGTIVKLFTSIDTLSKFPLFTDKDVQCIAKQEHISKTEMYDQLTADNVPNLMTVAQEKCEIEVVQGDCVEAAIRLKKLGFNPLMLNMASSKRPGGGYLNGSAAQEENLFRRSNYFQSLEASHICYPIPEFGAIYSPCITFFRGNEDVGYAYYEQPVSIACVAVAAYVRPQLIQNQAAKKKSGANHSSSGKFKKVEEPQMTEKFAKKTMQKIQTMLHVALKHGHDSLVLSAFGCGAYKNPPRHVAQIFKMVLNNGTYKNRFKKIVFAIIDDHNAKQDHNPNGNFEPFKQVFESNNPPCDEDSLVADNSGRKEEESWEPQWNKEGEY